MASLFKRPNSDNYWYQFRLDDKQYRGSTKTPDKKLAEKIAAAVEADYIRDRFSIPGLIKNNHIFSTVWKEYLKNQTTEIKRRVITSKHFLPVFQDISVEDIKNINIEEYQKARRLEILALKKNINKKDSEISFRSVNCELVILHHFFNYCVKKGYIEKNPAAGIKKLNELSRLKTLSDSDIDKLIAGATNKLTRDIISFLIYSGCRKGEALNLKWDDVDMQNNVISIKGTKTKYDRYIPIHTQLKAILSSIEKNQDSLYVFVKNGTKIGDFKGSFRTACKNAGMKDLRIHDLRHVFASKMVMNGTSLYITGELLGHRTTQMTKRYSHLVPDTLMKAANDAFKCHDLSEPPIKIDKDWFVISDTHFGDSKKEKFLIDNWNSIVGKDDDVLHLGDFVSKGKSVVVEEKIKKYGKLLNGRIFLIRGNHDSAPAEVYEKAGIKVINEYPGGHAAAASASLRALKYCFRTIP